MSDIGYDPELNGNAQLLKGVAWRLLHDLQDGVQVSGVIECSDR